MEHYGSREGGEDSCIRVERRFSPRTAARAQRLLAARLVVEDDFDPIRRVAGLDVSYTRRDSSSIGVGVAVLLSYPGLEVRECVAYISRVCIPYIPGLLAFREMEVLGPVLIRLASRGRVDLYVVDGHGIAHPRRFGIASHVGVVMDAPSIGVAKKRLYGREESLGGSRVLVDHSGMVLAHIIESGRGSRIYVSPGHRVSHATAARIISSMLRRGYRLPEPTRIADRVSRSLRGLLKSGRLTPGFIDCMTVGILADPSNNIARTL